jgi:LPXTG-motif cell wall-anchored protein
MKKLPVIGLIVGAVAALFALRKKKNTPEPETPAPVLEE